jgi:hypothetical protein
MLSIVDARIVTLMANKYKDLAPRLDEATLRVWAAVEAHYLERGGVAYSDLFEHRFWKLPQKCSA